MIWYAKFFLGELGPAVITFPHANYDAGRYPPYIQLMIPALARDSRSMPNLNSFVPVLPENLVEDSGNCEGLESRIERARLCR
jgi:hypothetical protein